MPPLMSVEEITTKLETWQSDPKMVTKGAYSPAAVDYPDNQLPYVQVHLSYLRKHRQVNPTQYLSNLEIMIRQR
jgi:hypothetical protein